MKYKTHHEYWELNIEKFAGFYDKTSQENIVGNHIVSFFYKRFIFPLEKKWVKIRYEYVKSYIEKNIKKGCVVADVGCGSGIFTKIIVKSGAKVYALDFSQSALNLTEKMLLREDKGIICLKKFDITKEKIPKVDFCITIGLLPYISKTETFFGNILPYTDNILVNFLDGNTILNRVRKVFPFLNVRGYYYHVKDEIIDLIKAAGFDIMEVKKLASGYIIEARKNY